MATQVRTANTTQTRVDFRVAVNDAMVGIGGKFGLYEMMAGVGPVTGAELAQRTGISEHDASFWLSAQAAEDYLHFDEASGRYSVFCEWPRSN
jgi:hypothetical protein